jgi:hypothetical protein
MTEFDPYEMNHIPPRARQSYASKMREIWASRGDRERSSAWTRAGKLAEVGDRVARGERVPDHDKIGWHYPDD